MLSRCLAILCALAGCTTMPGSVTFSAADGNGDGLHGCYCQYDDGTQGDVPSLQVLCESSGQLGYISLFVDATPAVDQPAQLILSGGPDSGGQFAAGGHGRYASLGAERRADNTIVRSISGIELGWDAQTACNVAYGCRDADTSLPIDAGALHDGHGDCEDLNAAIADEL